MNFQGDKNKASIGDLFVSTALGHQGPPIPSTHHLHLLHLPSLRPFLLSLCLFWSAFSPVDTEISIWCPWRSWNAGWPSYISLYIGLCSPCPEQPTNHSTRSTQEGEGRVNGSSQWAPALDWSRHNYHVNILLRIRWYNTHMLSGRMFPHQSQWTNILWWVSYGAIKELRRVWRRNERRRYRGTLHTAALCFTPIKGLLTTDRPQKVCGMHPL